MRLAISEQQHVGTMRAHEATGRSRQDNYTRVKDSTHAFMYRVAEMPWNNGDISSLGFAFQLVENQTN
jgi:hypothetical protein